ncbi:MAG: DnaD domain protein [Christensenellales bacterium]
MAFCAFSDTGAMYDSTPVENMFLLEFMPYAPDEYVKCYLYGLMLCHHPVKDMTAESFARALQLTEQKVMDAMRYWEQKGLLVGVSDNPPAFRFVSARVAMLQSPQEDDGAYRYRDFNNRLQSITGLLHPKQFREAMEWIEELHIPEDVVLEMAQFKAEAAKAKNGGKPRSVQYLFKIFRDTMFDWAKRDIRTLSKARIELSKDLPSYKLAEKILNYFNMRRNPTEAELALCDKWMYEWNYEEATILKALPATASGSNPSFAYLDAVLREHLSQEAGTTFEQSKKVFDDAKELLQTLGARSTRPTKEFLAAYEARLSEGFEHAVLLRAAASCCERNIHSPEQLARLLDKWADLGLLTEDAVAEYLKVRHALRSGMNRVFDAAGLDRRPSEAELEQFGEWSKRHGEDVILFAAQCARGTAMPVRHIDKILTEWAAAGVTSLQDAQREREAHKAKAPSAPKKENPALRYTQRSYTESDFDDFFVDLTQPVGGDAP